MDEAAPITPEQIETLKAFKSPRSKSTKSGPVAQSGERLPCKQEAAGSIPAGSTITPVAQRIEHQPSKLGVEGSNPSGRATKNSSTMKNIGNPPILAQNPPETADSSTSATAKSQREKKSRYRTPESAEAYRAAVRKRMAKHRAQKD